MKYIILFLFIAFVNPFPLIAQSTNISEGIIFDGEPFMLVDPNDQQHIIIAWMGFDGLELIKIKTRVTFNGGNAWSSITELPHIGAGYTSADPSMDFDSDGNIYLCFIDHNQITLEGGVYVYRSEDGGLTWNSPVEVINVADDGTDLPVDRPWMVVDRSGGIHDGNIYVTTKPAPWIPAPNRNYFIASTDNGNSFNDWRYIDTAGWKIGNFIAQPMAAPAISNNGTFHCIYPAFEITENLFPRFILASSINAGNTFNYQEAIESDGTDLIQDTIAKLGYQLIADPANDDHLAVLFILKPLGDADVYLLETFDAGNTWSEKIRVNDDPPSIGKMQDLVWGGFDNDGDLLICWRDRRNAPDTGFTTSTEIYGAIKWKDSLNFSNNFKVSDELVEFDDVLLGNGNDFMCADILNDTIYAVWGDTRNGKLNIWFNKIDAHSLQGTGIQNITSETRENIILFPNPVNDILTIKAEKIKTISIYDIEGKNVLEQNNINKDEINIDLHFLAKGVYTISIYGEKLYTTEFVKN